MSARPSMQRPTILSSWKEIASYLGKGVRTVQRWESEFGMPVRRPTENRHIVYASRQDLDEWLVSWAQRRPRAVLAPGNNNAGALSLGVKASRELRMLQRQLVSELHKSLADLAEQCKVIRLGIDNHQPARPARTRDGAVRTK